MVTEVVGVVSMSPGLRVGWIVEHDGLATEPTPATHALHHEVDENRRLARVCRPSRRCVSLRVIPLPERCDGIIQLAARVHQPDSLLATGWALVSFLIVVHRRTSEQE
jgi:hypothetical protein